MSLAEDGVLRPEPTKADSIRRRLWAKNEADRRTRAVAGVLWALFGVLMTLGSLAVGWGLTLSAPFLVATGLVLMGLWCGLTAVLIVRRL